MPASRRKPDPTPDAESVEARLLDGHYDRLLETFQATLREAAATLRRAHEAMKAENTLRS
jgi:hypothetical protein